MTGNDLLTNLTITLSRIGTNEKNIELFNILKPSFDNFHVIDSFSQIKKNDKGEGLALEIMMFDEKVIYDLVITSTTLDFITVFIKHVTMVEIETSFGTITNAKGEESSIDNLTLTISYGGDLRSLGYSTETKRFLELNRIKSKLVNLIK